MPGQEKNACSTIPRVGLRVRILTSHDEPGQCDQLKGQNEISSVLIFVGEECGDDSGYGRCNVHWNRQNVRRGSCRGLSQTGNLCNSRAEQDTYMYSRVR